jgi:hypothetical protein
VPIELWVVKELQFYKGPKGFHWPVIFSIIEQSGKAMFGEIGRI